MAVVIKKGESLYLRNLLKRLNKDQSKCLINFDDSETTLFVSGVILPAQDYHGEMLPETFVFATSFCGPFSKHLEDLINTSKKGLCKIFKHCQDFPENDIIEDKTLFHYLKSHRYPDAFNSSYNCITKKDVQREKTLRADIENYIDKAQRLNAFDSLSALQAKKLIQRYIRTRGDFYEWTLKPARKNLVEILKTNQVCIVRSLIILLPFIFWFNYPFCDCLFPKILGSALLVIVTLAVIVIFLLIIAWIISRKKTVTASRPSDDYVRKITATQLHPILNEMTAAGPLKKGKLRRYFYATALRVVNFVYTITVPTVSTIRWLVIDNKKRLLFLSNYSNTTDFYVRDFLVGSTPLGVNLMFTNGTGFPDAKLLFCGGISKDPEGYMNAVHTGQHVTDLWYVHEPNLTVDIINKNRTIRNGLFKRISEKKAREWLKLL